MTNKDAVICLLVLVNIISGASVSAAWRTKATYGNIFLIWIHATVIVALVVSMVK